MYNKQTQRIYPFAKCSKIYILNSNVISKISNLFYSLLVDYVKHADICFLSSRIFCSCNTKG